MESRATPGQEVHTARALSRAPEEREVQPAIERHRIRCQAHGVIVPWEALLASDPRHAEGGVARIIESVEFA